MAVIFPRVRRLARWCPRTLALPGALMMLGWPAVAAAQLDPLLFLRRVPPTVIIVMDTSMRMLEDGTGSYYDPNFYKVDDDPAVMGAFPNINTSTTRTYRRKYQGLQYVNSPGKYSATGAVAVPAQWDGVSAAPYTAADYAFLDPTRWAVARFGVAAAVGENVGTTYRWGLIRLRQRTPAWRASPNCDKPVTIPIPPGTVYKDTTPCNAGTSGQAAIYMPLVTAAQPSYAQATAPSGTVVYAVAANRGATIVTYANRKESEAGFIPAGLGGVGYEDRPLRLALVDARAAAVTAMNADPVATRECRNTVVVLIASGKDSGNSTYLSGGSVVTTAGTFTSVAATGVSNKRIPIVVIGIKPEAGSESELQAIAAASGGWYFKAETIADVAAAIHFAVQAGSAQASEFQTGKVSEFLPVTPVVGTVNLRGAKDAAGGTLPDTNITTVPGKSPVQQVSNVTVTAGFALPGFAGRIRAFRTYKPAADATTSSGWKFETDGTRLWPDLDGRPLQAGLARTSADPNLRNIFTFIPDGAGGGAVVAFTAANAAALSPHVGVTDVATLISRVRAQPLGAVISSMPAIMSAPSLAPAPDKAYGSATGATTFAGTYKDRRSMLFVGANDGMIHAIDARTGYEVWAFIPYNLLPKLRTLLDGQSIEQFDYFVDSSPKVTEVKLNGQWRSLLVIGQGGGGTFYQAFDVTDAGMGVAPDAEGLSAVTALLARFDAPNESITFKWAYPNYSSFDPTYTATLTVSDATPGKKVKMFGDLKATAKYAEKTVGFTWSDPAVGPLDAARTLAAVVVGSGYFPAIETLIPTRGSTAPKAGNALYLLNADTGALIGNPAGATCPALTSGVGSGSGCVSIGDRSDSRKNALQADPAITFDITGVILTRAYLGDVDGKYWRFAFTPAGVMSAFTMIDTAQPIYGSSALYTAGNSGVHAYFATGSDLLSSAAAGGTGIFKLYGLKDMHPLVAAVKFTQTLTTVANSAGLATGERPSIAPAIAGDVVFYTTSSEVAATPCAEVSSRLYAFNYTGGAAYDSNANDTLDQAESAIAGTLPGRATAPFTIDQHLYVSTTGAEGASVDAFGDPASFNAGAGQVGVRLLSWREIK